MSKKIEIGDIVITDGGHTGTVVSIDYQSEIANPYWYEVLCDGVLHCTFEVSLVEKIKRKKQSQKRSLAQLIGITLNS
jgi:preprotein translocase subunit YajC